MGDKNQHTVFVGNLPIDADSDELCTLFRNYGTVTSVRIMDGKTGGKYGFVTFAEEESANNALARKGHKYKDSAIMVKPAVKRRDVLKGSSSNQGQSGNWFGANKYNMNQNRPDVVSTVPVKRTLRAAGDAASSGVWKQNVDLQPGEMVTIIATHIESPTTFYGQIKDKVKQQDVLKMFQILGTLCNSCEAFSGVPELDKVYAAKYSSDGNWYRCKVLSLKEDDQCEVQYIDYGNKEVVKNVDLRVIPSKQVTKPFAIQCSLSGLKSSYDSGTIGFLKGVSLLESLILDKEITARVAHTYSPAVHKLMVPLEVKCGEKDINAELVEAGFATRILTRVDLSNVRSPESKPPFGRSQMEHRPQETQDVGKSSHRSFQTSPSDSSDHQRAPTIDTWEPNESFTVPVASQNMMSASSGMQQHSPDSVLRLQTELSNAKSKINYLTNELLKYQHRCEEMRYLEKEKNDTLLEYGKMKADLRAVEAQLEHVVKQLQETNLNHRLKVLLMGVNRIKHLRLQFPSERQTQDNIEWAGQILLDTQNRISLGNLQVKKDVDQLKKEYELAQENIKACVQQAELDSLIKTRDDSRKALHKVLLEFDGTTRQMPLEKRRQTLQAILSALQKTHSSFLKPDVNGNMTLSEVLDQYRQWKAQKMTEFREKRVRTNTCHNLLSGSLNLLQQELALDVVGSGSSSLTAANLDDPINRYTAAVHDELSVTDIENTADASLITMVLKIMIKEICSELANIDQLLSLHDASQRLAHQLEQWLETKPDLSTLFNVRKTIKSLKSKLRHKLADKQDLEESDDCDKEELQHVEQEVSSLREELQQAFVEEDKCLAVLAKLCMNHFPELPIQYPEAGIELEMEYRGLFKPGCALEYFNVESLKGCDKPSVMKSSYCGRPVVLKEFIVDDTHSVQKTDFLHQAMVYSSIQNQNLVPVEAVFCIKDKRNIYIRLPYYETTIHDVIAEGSLSPKKLHSILSGILHGLNTLHESGLIHGAVHPNNIFVTSENVGVLAEFDFSKTLVQRIERKYTAANGLTFMPPEVSAGDQLSMASDVYCFGLLALWIVTGNSSRLPCLDNVSVEDPNLLDLLHGVLSENPARRPTAGQLLSFAYFVDVANSLPCNPIKVSPELLTLQLRPKQPSPPAAERNHTGILKNGSPSPPSVSDSLPQQPTGIDAIAAALTNTLSADIVRSTQDGVDIAELSDKEVCDILTGEDQNDNHCPNVVSGVCEVKREEPEVNVGYVLQDIKEDGLSFEGICEVDIPSMPAWVMDCEESGPSVNGEMQADLDHAGTDSQEAVTEALEVCNTDISTADAGQSLQSPSSSPSPSSSSSSSSTTTWITPSSLKSSSVGLGFTLSESNEFNSCPVMDDPKLKNIACDESSDLVDN